VRRSSHRVQLFSQRILYPEGLDDDTGRHAAPSPTATFLLEGTTACSLWVINRDQGQPSGGDREDLDVPDGGRTDDEVQALAIQGGLDGHTVGGAGSARVCAPVATLMTPTLAAEAVPLRT